MVPVALGPDEQAAWADIYVEHGQAMRKVARLMLRDQLIDGKTADEIVGDVLADIMLKGIPAVKNIRSYLCEAVRNRVRDAYRRHARVDWNEPDLNENPSGEDVQADVEVNVLAGAATEALAEIPERERYAIEQRIMLARPAKDVAEDLGVEPQRISQLYNAGLRRIRESPSFNNARSRDSTVTGAPPARPPETPT